MRKLAITVRSVTVAALVGAAAVGMAAGNADAAQTTGTYGDPAGAVPFWVEQTLDDCSLMSTADVVGQLTGVQPSEREIVALAGATASAYHDGPIYLPPRNRNDSSSGHGTDSRDLPILLAHYGIGSDYTDDDVAAVVGQPTGMGALEDAVEAGRKVIAGVNAEMIWAIDGDRTRADHDLVVTGVDTTSGIVHLNDSGTDGGANEQVPISLFEASWATSDHDMVITDDRC